MSLSPQVALDMRMLDRVRRIIYDAAGIVLNDSKASMVRARLSKRLAATGHDDIAAYLDFVEHDQAAEMSNLISAMTTNVTQFFREAHHFDTLRDKVVPQWSGTGGTRLVWSAACSSGMEPYSIALTLLNAGLGRAQVKVLATDIDRKILARACEGRYPARELDAVDPGLRARYFSREGDEYVVGAELRAMVTFRALNLIGDWPFKGRFDAIFCRNVAIYFDAPTQERMWTRLTDTLAEGGVLFIGHSERLPDTLIGTRVAYQGQTTYIRIPPSYQKQA